MLVKWYCLLLTNARGFEKNRLRWQRTEAVDLKLLTLLGVIAFCHCTCWLQSLEYAHVSKSRYALSSLSQNTVYPYVRSYIQRPLLPHRIHDTSHRRRLLLSRLCCTLRGLCLSVCFCVCAGHGHELSKNGWTHRDAADLYGPKEPCIRWGCNCCILAPPGEYQWTMIRARPRCRLTGMSDYSTACYLQSVKRIDKIWLIFDIASKNYIKRQVVQCQSHLNENLVNLYSSPDLGMTTEQLEMLPSIEDRDQTDRIYARCTYPLPLASARTRRTPRRASLQLMTSQR